VEDGIPGGLQHCHKICCKKGSRRGRQACMVQRWHHCEDVVFRTGGLVYDTFIANYRRELMMGTDIKRKEKIEKVTKFVERMKKV